MMSTSKPETGNTYCGRFLDFIIDYVMSLPLAITEDSKTRTVRMLGLLWFCIWVLPITVICAPFSILAGLGEMIELTWGDK